MKTRRGGRGFALMLALFLIVTLAAVSVYLLTVSTGQLEASAQDEQAARAHQAARTGLEVAAYGILRPPNLDCAGVAQTLSLGGGLTGFSVTVTCSESSEDEGERAGPGAVRLFQVTATGCNSGGACPGAPGPTYAERQLHLTLSR